MPPTTPLGDNMSITAARANLGPLVRWVARTQERITITERGCPAAVLISAQNSPTCRRRLEAPPTPASQP